MDMEEQVQKALLAELERQGVRVERDGDGRATIHGQVDLEALSLVLVTTLAGGP